MPLFSLDRKLMGTRFSLGIVLEDEEQAKILLEEAVQHIEFLERLLSHFRSDSETSKINKFAQHEFVKVHPICFSLIERAIQLSKLTAGAFDITVSPLKKLYAFSNKETFWPDSALLRAALDKVGYQHILLNQDKGSIRFARAGMALDFSAIGKGFASDYVKKKWKAAGVASGYINASGDLNAMGLNEHGLPWQVGIAHPQNIEKALLTIALKDQAIATSGDYEQYVLHEGRRYGHNISPFDGRPISGIQSVSVIAPAAELADALATAVYVKGVHSGLKMIDQLPKTHAIIIDEKNKVHCSKDLVLNR